MENLTNWCIYMHENRENGKKYIGITSQKPTNRWQNGEGYQRCPRFYAAIKKYGWDAFRHDILYTGLTQEEAERLEVELIAKYRTRDPEMGYNLAVGGETNAGFHRSDEFKQKVSAARAGVYTGTRHNMYGVPRSEETKNRISEAQRGKPKSEEARQRMAESARKRWAADNVAEREHLHQLNAGEKHPRARSVRCVETGATYGAIREAAQKTGIDQAGILKCCKGERSTAGGYRWEYVEKAVVNE